MIDHLKEVLIEVVLKRVLPSVIAALAAMLAAHSKELAEWGVSINYQVFQTKALPVVMAVAIGVAHYGMFLWEKIQNKAAQPPQGGQK